MAESYIVYKSLSTVRVVYHKKSIQEKCMSKMHSDITQRIIFLNMQKCPPAP